MVKVVFLGSGAANRSQMAVGWARAIAAGNPRIAPGLEFIAADIEPRDLHPLAVQTMLQLAQTDISALSSLRFKEIDFSQTDIVICLTEQAAQCCTVLPGAPVVLRWELADPIAGPGEQLSERFAANCREIQHHILDFFQDGYFHTIIALKNNNEIILDHFPEGVIVHDRNRIIRWFNRAAEKITGHDRRSVIGRDCWEVFNGGFCGEKCSFYQPRTSIQQAQYPVRINSKTGKSKQVEMSVQAMHDHQGVFQGILACFKDVTEVTELRHRLKQIQSFHGIVGKDESMHGVYELITDLAGSDCPVLILGESGTGKELVANAIHGESPRSGKPFVTVNCGALPEGILESELFGHVRGAFTGATLDKKGRFELADTGTIFLDEIAELSPAMQVKLLRVLQEGTFEPVGSEKTVRVNVRILSATNRDLKKMVAREEFREDLFYRLCVVPVELPPLRQRRNDIPMLVEHFIGRFNQANPHPITGISAEAMNQLMDYPWPGNIRELQNAIQYAFVKCKNNTIDVRHLPPEIIAAKPEEAAEKSHRKGKLTSATVASALKQAKGNKVKAAQILGVGRATLYRFLQETDLPASSL